MGNSYLEAPLFKKKRIFNRALSVLLVLGVLLLGWHLPHTTFAAESVEEIRRKVAANDGIHVLIGKDEFFAKDRAGMEKTLNGIWSILTRHGVILSRIDVVREGNRAVLYSFTPTGGVVRRN